MDGSMDGGNTFSFDLGMYHTRFFFASCFTLQFCRMDGFSVFDGLLRRALPGPYDAQRNNSTTPDQLTF